MVKKADAGVHVGIALAVELDRDKNIRFARLAGLFPDAHGAASFSFHLQSESQPSVRAHPDAPPAQSAQCRDSSPEAFPSNNTR